MNELGTHSSLSLECSDQPSYAVSICLTRVYDSLLTEKQVILAPEKILGKLKDNIFPARIRLMQVSTGPRNTGWVR